MSDNRRSVDDVMYGLYERGGNRPRYRYVDVRLPLLVNGRVVTERKSFSVLQHGDEMWDLAIAHRDKIRDSKEHREYLDRERGKRTSSRRKFGNQAEYTCPDILGVHLVYLHVRNHGKRPFIRGCVQLKKGDPKYLLRSCDKYGVKGALEEICQWRRDEFEIPYPDNEIILLCVKKLRSQIHAHYVANGSQ